MTTTKDLVEILGAVEKATEGTREIDRAIYLALCPFANFTEHRSSYATDPDAYWYWMAAQSYSTSIDAALALVEKMLRPDNPHMTMNLQFIWTGTQDRGWCRAEITWPSHERIGHAPTAPLAILAALIRTLTQDPTNANG